MISKSGAYIFEKKVQLISVTILDGIPEPICFDNVSVVYFGFGFGQNCCVNHLNRNTIQKIILRIFISFFFSSIICI